MAHDHTPEIHEHADAWHHHIPEEGMPQHEHAAKVDSGALIKWFIGITVLLVVVVLALKMYFTKFTTQMRRTYVETTEIAQGAKTALAAAEATLGTDGRPFTYKVANKQARTVQLPIDTAIKRTVERYSGNQQQQPQNNQPQNTPANRP
ncbi:MAG TPA: hypothetical protein VD997_12325 [Phycisphaerales bacterium]|nr:hypothetical protein [Phycisphaerales bacterium]